MSLQFSNTTTKDGVIQGIERRLKLGDGAITGDTQKFYEFTAEINLAKKIALYKAMQSSGRWQFEDTNQTDYPIIKTNIVSGQRDYTFTTDGSGNFILDIHKVLILPSATATTYWEISPVDQQSDLYTGIAMENGIVGIPSTYDKTGNSIQFANATPNYAATNGLKVLINRDTTYYTTADTTKTTGFPSIFDEYFIVRPMYIYACNNTLANEVSLRDQVIKFEGDEERGIHGMIERYFSSRSRDERDQLTMAGINFR